MSISIADAIREGAQQLRQVGVLEPRREAGSLVAHVLNQDRSFILTHPEEELGPDQAKLLREWLARRASGEPLQYLTGRQEFYGLDFEVTPDVLIPRPESEVLVEAALKLMRELTGEPFICDIGTGSGCLATTLLHELRTARALAIDISLPALEVAKRNAARHAVNHRIGFVAADCFSAFSLNGSSPALFDMVVSNPPYVKEDAMAGLQREVRDYEPRTALAAGRDGLAIIRRLLLDTPRFLKPSGYLLFEIGFDQGLAVEQLIDPNVWKLLEIHPDLQGIPRIVALEKVS